jgi:ATP-dependent Lon protease
LKTVLRQYSSQLGSRFPKRAPRLIAQSLELRRPRSELIDVIGNLLLSEENVRKNFLCATSLSGRITLLLSVLPSMFEVSESPEDAKSSESDQPVAQHSQRLDARLFDDLGEEDIDLDAVIGSLSDMLPEDRRKRVANLIRSYDLSKSEACRDQLNTLESLASFPFHGNVPAPAVVRQRLDENFRFHRHVVDRLVDTAVIVGFGKAKRAPVMLLVGSPGLGKTEVARAFADSLDRPFASMNLGGVHDAIAVAGSTPHFHNSCPGGIVTGLMGAGALNPVFLLDEIDKMAASSNGDPAAVLLEVLGSNDGLFTDHFLGIPLNLSNVIWIATANSTDPIHPALLDRMKIVQIPNYSEDQRLDIIRGSLIPRALGEWSVGDQISFTEDAVTYIERRTRPLCSLRTVRDSVDQALIKAVTQLMEGQQSVVIDHEFLMQHLGQK